MSAQISELSKTYQYRKVMKPMLERKRRARINKCLDELKDLMVVTLESEGEHVTRLEKADILELTVSYLQKMKRQRSKRIIGGNDRNNEYNSETMTQAEGFRSGYIHAVNEVSRSLSGLPGVNVHLGTQLMTHLGQKLNQIQPPAIKNSIPITSPLCVQIGNPTFRNTQNQHQNQNQNQNHHHRSYSVPLSPISRSSTDSPTSTSLYNETQLSSSSIYNYQLATTKSASLSLLTTCPIKTTTTTANSSRNLHNSEENVWRPW